MLKGQQIIYIANDWFGENKTSAHHIAEELSRHNVLLYVEAAGQRAPRATGRDVRKILRKLRESMQAPTRVDVNVFRYAPLILPFHRFAVVRWVNRHLLRFFIRRAAGKVGFRKPLLWIVLPHYASVLDDVDSKGIVYYCVDEYSSQPGVEPERIREMERAVLARADVAFAVSKELLEKKRPLNANTYHSPHGVETDRFARANDESTEVPADIAGIKPPVAGFFGLIEDWIDLDLIAHAARRLPDVSFVLIGSVARSVDGLGGIDNVHLLGHRPYDSLPGYLKAFSVGLLPYKLNTQVINSNPKKLREYLAGGRPVVSVPVREVEPYAEFVEIAGDREQFAQAIVRAIREDSPERRMERIAAMAGESWEARVEAVSEKVSRHIPEVPDE